MKNDEPIQCQKCGKPLSPDMRFCPECGEALPPSSGENRRVNVIDASGGGTVNVSGERTGGPARVNVVDASDRGTVAMGPGATAVGAGAQHIGQQVIIENQVIQVPGLASRFDVPNNTVLRAPLFPRCAAELDYPIRISDGATVEGTLFTAKELIVGNNVTIKGPVFAREGIAIGKECQFLNHAYSTGPIRIESQTRIEGIVVSTARQATEIGDHCQAKGIAANGNVMTGTFTEFMWIHAAADVSLGPSSKADYVTGHNIMIGAGSQVGCIVATGDLRLESNVMIDRCSVGGKLYAAQTATIRLMDTYVQRGPLPPGSLPFRMVDQTVTEENVFVLQHGQGQLLPYSDVPTVDTDALLIITRYLTARLARAIRYLTHARFDLNLPAA